MVSDHPPLCAPGSAEPSPSFAGNGIRDFTPEEIASWKALSNYDSAAPGHRLILLIGPAAAGKSYFCAKNSKEKTTFFDLDGDPMRAVHGDWRPDDSTDPEALFERMKPVVARLKAAILAEATKEGRNAILPLTFSTASNWEQLQLFQDAGYRVQGLNVFLANYDTIVRRIDERGDATGRRQMMSVGKYEKCIGALEEIVRSRKMAIDSVEVYDTTDGAMKTVFQYKKTDEGPELDKEEFCLLLEKFRDSCREPRSSCWRSCGVVQ